MTKEPARKPKIELNRELTDRELTINELDAVTGGDKTGRAVLSDIPIVKIVDRPSPIL
jgi:bacteriocin-like protein